MVRRILVLLVVIVLASTGCADGARPPARQPDVTGTVEKPARDVAVLTAASDSYYEGMQLHGMPYLDGGTGDQLVDVAELTPGTTVAVWIAGACAESFPVQCEIEAVQVQE